MAEGLNVDAQTGQLNKSCRMIQTVDQRAFVFPLNEQNLTLGLM